MANRLRINWNVVHDLLKNQETQEVIREHTRRIDRAVVGQGGQSRVDFSAEGERARGAVIAGYEPGATAESTRAQLLQALDGGE
ncbi:hypothetical protein AVV13_gp09 [Streptomyces phage SF1]|uniref:Uncharacterized protein n=2 Tax=Caudoviricetes TaxID=2731619 RepID=A0A0K1Y575_9CAUD|nr:hypothetical protein AVV13_gp09 [Streptomyces phage SF1]YP_009796732.1 hypothetical protein HOS57_gp10 [Streptomyces phage AbbeyMikolon]AKY02158.1 hypothetical protein SF1_90 [Streptomyces phage SF1]AUG87082.1 hypothetical protein SEA_ABBEYMIKOLON_10 [Streptomyces phage AbbeyMikolon]